MLLATPSHCMSAPISLAAGAHLLERTRRDRAIPWLPLLPLSWPARQGLLRPK